MRTASIEPEERLIEFDNPGRVISGWRVPVHRTKVLPGSHNDADRILLRNKRVIGAVEAHDHLHADTEVSRFIRCHKNSFARLARRMRRSLNTMGEPPLGLLLDVDGPISSPSLRRIAIPSIVDDLVTLAAAGIPIAFITGRSDTFMREEIVLRLLNAGLPAGVRMFGVGEKGAIWFPITSEGVGTVEIDRSVALPDDYTAELRDITEQRFSEEMFFDATKHAMISLEQNANLDDASYLVAQNQVNQIAFDLLVEYGLGARYGEQEFPDANGQISYRVDPTIISTDVESVTLNKDRGAQRALDYFRAGGDLPTLWRTVGDSRSDYLMADYLHTCGFDVAHVDVRPADGILERPYRVIVENHAIHDEAGAAFLRHWVRTLRG